VQENFCISKRSIYFVPDQNIDNRGIFIFRKCFVANYQTVPALSFFEKPQILTAE